MQRSILKKSIIVLFVMLAVVFLSGCLYKNQPQEQVLRDAEQYNIKTYGERNADASPAAHRLSVSASQENAADQSSQENNSKQPSTMQIETNKNYSAVLKTGAGDITIDLDVKKTPITANNFVALSRQNFYNGTIFHRVIKGFMIQGGDPNGDGTGGPGYQFADENLEGKYTRGTVAMANSGPNTNGSQFFIIHKDYDLPNNYVIFGYVSAGMDIVDKIAEAEVTASASGEKSKPVNPVKIESIEISEK